MLGVKLQLADLCAASGRTADAVKFYQRIIELAPGTRVAQTALILASKLDTNMLSILQAQMTPRMEAVQPRKIVLTSKQDVMASTTIRFTGNATFRIIQARSSVADAVVTVAEPLISISGVEQRIYVATTGPPVHFATGAIQVVTNDPDAQSLSIPLEIISSRIL